MNKIANYIPISIIKINREFIIKYANSAAEILLGESSNILLCNELSNFIQLEQHFLQLIENVLTNNSLIREYDFSVFTVKTGSHKVNLQILAIDESDEIMIVIDDLSGAGKLTNHILKRENTVFAGNMAAILAHEIKNPLSGIKGAAQLLQTSVSYEDKKLTDIICNEVDRIRLVIEEMDIFSNKSEIKFDAVNIHEILKYIRGISEAGIARKINFHEIYDPSIPEVIGNRNLLVQLFLNLIKNAAEALENSDNPTITISTTYQSGLRFKSQHGKPIQSLPIIVTIEDNGSGISPDLRKNIFEPFVTSKSSGKGLGLAIVAKIIADHGGAIELDETTRYGTKFRILLPEFRN